MPNFEFRVITLPRWVLVLALSLVLALGLTLAVIAAGLFLIIFPVMLVVAAVAAVIGLLRGRNAVRRDIRIIDADYVVHHEPLTGDEQRAGRRSAATNPRDRDH